MDYLKKLRKESGLTQVEFAKKMNISSSYYIKIEGGFMKPSYNFMKTLKKSLGEQVDLNKLVK